MFSVLRVGNAGSGQQWLADAGPGIVAMLALSESPGLFIKIPCPLAPSIDILLRSVLGRVWESMFLQMIMKQVSRSLCIIWGAGNRQ